MFTKAATLAAFAGLVAASPAPQGVTSAIAPKETTPAGCSQNYPSKFEINVVNATHSKRDEGSVALLSSLKDGVLTDARGRTGYIASNNQFQYDGPPQAGAIYTAGFSICQNNTLALGDSAIFYKCLSGTFYNLYDDVDEKQCSPVYIEILPQGPTVTANAVSGKAAAQLADGQVTASPVSNVACQIGDGQLQQNTCSGQVVTQISDGQIQAATKVNAVTQISDGQIQAPTGHPVTQISDGQIQAPTAVSPVTQIHDGQIQAPVNNTTKPSVVPYTGAGSKTGVSGCLIVGLVAAVFAL